MQAIGHLGRFLEAIFQRLCKCTIVLKRVFLQRDPSDWLEGNVEVKGNTIFAKLLQDIKLIGAEPCTGATASCRGNCAGG